MRFLRFFGKFLISSGVGILIFVGWTLWGTGIYTQNQQRELGQTFERLPAIRPVQQAGSVEFAGPPESFKPEPGSAVFQLRMPSLDASYYVVEGVGREELESGPGHYPACRPGFDRPLCTEFEEVWPGEKGRVIVSGHRTTFGAPFYDLDKLVKGDDIITRTKWGDFTYEVTETRIVRPDSLAIAVQSEAAELVLTTCHPKYSAAQRLIVFARLKEASI